MDNILGMVKRLLTAGRFTFNLSTVELLLAVGAVAFVGHKVFEMLLGAAPA
tara:strand:+ start:2342 stop:2494 length:153 start_codon:yes stop_codon:yes gene_type:complete